MSQQKPLQFRETKDSAVLARLSLWLTIATLLSFMVWAKYAMLAEVAVGEGKIVPSTKAKVIQSLEGGILTGLYVHEGDIVEPGQKLAQLDPVTARAIVEETSAKINTLLARSARLKAEIAKKSKIVFPEAVLQDEALMAGETQLFEANRSGYQTSIRDVEDNLKLASNELRILKPLLASGAANRIEILRIEQRVGDLRGKLNDLNSKYFTGVKRDLTATFADLDPLLKIRDARSELLKRTDIMSPSRGIVKEIEVSTLGGVVSPGGKIMIITPIDDQLLVEARISPRDIAFIHLGQPATVKISAYDSSIYGILPSEVEQISPDTTEDTVSRGQFYYRVYVRTAKAFLQTKDGKQHPIIPGMIATAEISTGQKTVMDYLLKPLNKAAEAMRER
jgi:membrane fusion protein, adhesin transport system